MIWTMSCCSVSKLCDSLRSHGLQHAWLLYPSLFPRICSNLYLLCWWCHPTISSSVVPFSSRLHFFPASVSFPVNQFFASSGQSIGASALAPVLSINIQSWLPLGLIGLISLQSKWLSRVFSSITVWKHQFLGAQPSLRPNSHIHSDLAQFNC